MYAYPTMDDIITRSITVLWVIGTILTIYYAGRMAQRRGRSFKNWALIAGFLIGPLVFPLLWLLPNLKRKDPQGPEAGKRPADATGAVRPVIQRIPDPSRLNTSFAFR
jgi:hypothetical protein